MERVMKYWIVVYGESQEVMDSISCHLLEKK